MFLAWLCPSDDLYSISGVTVSFRWCVQCFWHDCVRLMISTVPFWHDCVRLMISTVFPAWLCPSDDLYSMYGMTVYVWWSILYFYCTWLSPSDDQYRLCISGMAVTAFWSGARILDVCNKFPCQIWESFTQGFHGWELSQPIRFVCTPDYPEAGS